MTMNHPDSEQLALHSGGDLPAEETQAVDEHLALCELCRTELGEIASSMDAFRLLAVEDGSRTLGVAPRVAAQLFKRSRVRWYGVAAAAAVFAAVGAGLLWTGQRSRPVQPKPEVLATSRVPDLGRGQSDGDPVKPAAKRVTFHPAMARVKTGMSPDLATQREIRVMAVSRQSESGEPMELRLATSNPNVVVLWQMDDGGTEEKGTGGRQ